MELRQLRYFIALAEEGSFTRAAERLHITQPPLSQQIKLLEQALGVRLFERSARGATLTEAGRAFLRHARALTEGVQAAVRETSAISDGSSGTVRIGSINSALFSAVPGILELLRRRLPTVGISLTELGSQAQRRALLEGEIDLGLMHMPYPTTGLRVQQLLSERLMAALPAGHRLAGQASVHLSALADEDFVFALRDVAPVSFDQMIAECVRAGFSPRIRHTAGQLATIAQIVRLGMGVAIVPESVARMPGGGVEFVPLRDADARLPLFLACRDATLAPVVERVRACVMSIDLVSTPGHGRRRRGAR